MLRPGQATRGANSLRRVAAVLITLKASLTGFTHGHYSCTRITYTFIFFQYRASFYEVKYQYSERYEHEQPTFIELTFRFANGKHHNHILLPIFRRYP